jgi:SAM-dependent methyltransferase
MIHAKDTYKDFAGFYDIYVGKYTEDIAFYKAYCSKCNEILEVGCGTGRILLHLLQSGCRVTGVDISQEMLEKASAKLAEWKHSENLTLLNHNFEVGPLDTTFDRALVTFYTFNYILEKPVQFLKNIYESLSGSGILLMDLFYPNALCNPSIDDKWLNKEFSVEGVKVIIKDNRKMIGNMEQRQQIFIIGERITKIDTQRKYYQPQEVKLLLKEAGFSAIQFAYDYDYNSFAGTLDETGLKNNFIIRAVKR